MSHEEELHGHPLHLCPGRHPHTPRGAWCNGVAVSLQDGVVSRPLASPKAPGDSQGWGTRRLCLNRVAGWQSTGCCPPRTATASWVPPGRQWRGALRKREGLPWEHLISKMSSQVAVYRRTLTFWCLQRGPQQGPRRLCHSGWRCGQRPAAALLRDRLPDGLPGAREEEEFSGDDCPGKESSGLGPLGSASPCWIRWLATAKSTPSFQEQEKVSDEEKRRYRENYFSMASRPWRVAA